MSVEEEIEDAVHPQLSECDELGIGNITVISTGLDLKLKENQNSPYPASLAESNEWTQEERGKASRARNVQGMSELKDEVCMSHLIQIHHQIVLMHDSPLIQLSTMYQDGKRSDQDKYIRISPSMLKCVTLLVLFMNLLKYSACMAVILCASMT